MAGDVLRPRVVITGMGAVCAWGWGVPALREGLSTGRTAIAPFGRFDHARHRTHVAGEVPDGPGPSFDRGPLWGRLSYADRFALFAAREALAQAGLTGALVPAATGVYFGTSTGGS
jgi:3-oxoacyl-(acyl-carrier-protein) synthase